MLAPPSQPAATKQGSRGDPPRPWADTHVVHRLLLLDVLGLAADDDSELRLIVHLGRVRRDLRDDDAARTSRRKYKCEGGVGRRTTGANTQNGHSLRAQHCTHALLCPVSVLSVFVKTTGYLGVSIFTSAACMGAPQRSTGGDLGRHYWGAPAVDGAVCTHVVDVVEPDAEDLWRVDGRQDDLHSRNAWRLGSRGARLLHDRWRNRTPRLGRPTSTSFSVDEMRMPAGPRSAMRAFVSSGDSRP